jgi:MoxR-like ATPase
MHLKEAKQMVQIALDINRPLMLWGGIGIGKSALIDSFYEDGYEIMKLFLTWYEPTQVRGFAIPDTERNRMVWLPPEDFPHKDTPTILFLDEINLAPPATQRAAYQLILERQVGAYKLPPATRIVAAGNRTSDKTGTYELLPALANRFLHLECDVNFNVWVEWARDNKIHNDIIAFLAFKQDLFWKPDLYNTGPAFPTPRTWQYASEIYSHTSTPSDIELAVGQSASAAFTKFIKIRERLPAPDMVLTNREPLKDPELLLSFLPVLIRYLGNDPSAITLAAKWLETLEPDFSVLFLTMAPKEISEALLTNNTPYFNRLKDILFGGD